MEETRDVTVSPTPHAKITINSRAFPFKKYRYPEAIAHSLSADAKFPDLTPAPTITIPLSTCVLKSPVWHTEFLTTHKQRKVSLHGKLPKENNLTRETLTKGNISKFYKN